VFVHAISVEAFRIKDGFLYHPAIGCELGGVTLRAPADKRASVSMVLAVTSQVSVFAIRSVELFDELRHCQLAQPDIKL